MGLNRKKKPRERATGEGPDKAVVGGWLYRGRHKPLAGGDGQFEYTDRSGAKKTTHRFTLKRKKDE